MRNRAKEKQQSRDQDERDLRDGKVTKEELRKRNGFFSCLDLANFKIKLKNGKKIK